MEWPIVRKHQEFGESEMARAGGIVVVITRSVLPTNTKPARAAPSQASWNGGVDEIPCRRILHVGVVAARFAGPPRR